MKPICLPVLLLLACIEFSCKDEHRQSDIINRSEILLKTNPDSAYILLNSISAPWQMSDKLLARWCMLTSRCANRLHEEMPYTDLLVEAQKWYNKHGTGEERARIGLYLGRSYAENKAFEKAMATYMDALEVATKNKIYNQAGYISSYMADLYEFKDMPEKALKKFEEGAGYFRKGENQRSYALVLRDIARIWGAYLDSVDMALSYMEKADSIACALNDPKAMSSTANGLGNLYSMNNEYSKAEKYYLKSLEFEKKDNAPTFLALSVMYTNIGNLDKARYYIEQIKSQTKNDDTSSGAIYQKYLIEKADHNIEKAFNYLEQFDLIEDSVSVLQNESNILKIEKKYQHEKVLKENNQLRIGRQNLFILIIILIIVCLSAFIFYQIKLNKQQKKIFKQQITLNQNKLTLTNLNHQLEEGEKNLSETRIQLNKTNEQLCLQDTLESQQAALRKHKKELEKINAEILRLHEEKLLTSSVGRKVINLSKSVKAGCDKSPLTSKDWIAIRTQVDEIYISLSQILQNNSTPLSPSDIECCYLSFFQLDPQAESILLNINPHSASRRRSRLREKLGIKGENNSLYDYLSKI